MTADVLTKSLNGSLFKSHVAGLGLLDVTVRLEGECFKEAKVASTPQVAALACLLAYLVASTPQVAIT